jgi:predicted nuclease with TOPRIM domain
MRVGINLRKLNKINRDLYELKGKAEYFEKKYDEQVSKNEKLIERDYNKEKEETIEYLEAECRTLKNFNDLGRSVRESQEEQISQLKGKIEDLKEECKDLRNCINEKD